MKINRSHGTPFISNFGVSIGYLCCCLQTEIVLFEQPLKGKFYGQMEKTSLKEYCEDDLYKFQGIVINILSNVVFNNGYMCYF